MTQKLKKYILIVSITLASVFSVGFVDSYFEVSKNLDIFATLFRELNIYYVDDTDPGELMKTGIDAMLESLDPYTNYIPESNIEDYKLMTTGQYGGIGALIQQHGEHVVISEPYEGFGAYKAGLWAGDRLLKIDGKDVTDKSTSEIRDLLLGQPGTTLNITVERPGTEEPIEKKVVREEVKIDDVPYYKMYSNDIGYIKLNGFTESAGAEVKAAFTKLKEQNAKSLILDLRGNGGGLMKEAIDIVNYFVPKGSEVVSTKGKISDWDKVYKATAMPIDTEIPIVVLIDEMSASASEIVSGALQDHDRAVIIGNRSFGKGLVQQVRPLSYNSKLKVTVAKYYTPSGRCIQKLDYSHKDEDGKVNAIPDSLIREFKTLKTYRPVFDGMGIEPDIKVEKKEISDIATSLYLKNHLFDYATDFKLKNNAIPEVDAFTISDEEYEKFVKFLEGKDYDYTTDSEALLEKLEKAAKADKYFKSLENEYNALLNKLKHNKEEDLYTFKEEIKYILETEIATRYYYQKGKMEASLKTDPVMEKAIEVLSDKQKYDAIFAGNNTKQD
ncbi:MAG: S41 family peptidase [Vicingaceae bacterium]|jgi:carboxyl-terminal processing protease|nr:S41 family peptidase [Flavobacteriales bacterium]MBQ19212.1 peptidase S41 [Flavobacteriales bacterium]MDF1676603.1 S41 family peptidase [Vicingaceae bacterium]|tara:strand:- start:62904 stop:64571 length:1668 start_codon:yes stop_codon:yes gene_type:complete